MRGLDEIWRDFVEYFMLIPFKKLIHEKKGIIAIEKIGQKREISLVL